MNKSKLFILLSVLFVFFPGNGSCSEAANAAAMAMESVADEYRLGAGDVLEISVWKDEALTRTVVVLPDGKISFPLIGQVSASGKTVAALKKELEERLKKYVQDPVLTVGVQQVNSMLIYVIGRVNSPGRYILNTNVTILQALSIAGGLNPFAERKNIKIFRKSGNETKVLYFNYDELTEKENVLQNIPLIRGDVVVVP